MRKTLATAFVAVVASAQFQYEDQYEKEVDPIYVEEGRNCKKITIDDWVGEDFSYFWEARDGDFDRSVGNNSVWTYDGGLKYCRKWNEKKRVWCWTYDGQDSFKGRYRMLTLNDKGDLEHEDGDYYSINNPCPERSKCLVSSWDDAIGKNMHFWDALYGKQKTMSKKPVRWYKKRGKYCVNGQPKQTNKKWYPSAEDFKEQPPVEWCFKKQQNGWLFHDVQGSSLRIRLKVNGELIFSNGWRQQLTSEECEVVAAEKELPQIIEKAGKEETLTPKERKVFLNYRRNKRRAIVEKELRRQKLTQPELKWIQSERQRVSRLVKTFQSVLFRIQPSFKQVKDDEMKICKNTLKTANESCMKKMIFALKAKPDERMQHKQVGECFQTALEQAWSCMDTVNQNEEQMKVTIGEVKRLALEAGQVDVSANTGI